MRTYILAPLLLLCIASAAIAEEGRPFGGFLKKRNAEEPQQTKHALFPAKQVKGSAGFGSLAPRSDFKPQPTETAPVEVLPTPLEKRDAEERARLEALRKEQELAAKQAAEAAAAQPAPSIIIVQTPAPQPTLVDTLISLPAVALRQILK